MKKEGDFLPKKLSTLCEYFRLYQRQREKACKDYDVNLLSVYHKIDIINYERGKLGLAPIYPILFSAEHLFGGSNVKQKRA